VFLSTDACTAGAWGLTGKWRIWCRRFPEDPNIDTFTDAANAKEAAKNVKKKFCDDNAQKKRDIDGAANSYATGKPNLPFKDATITVCGSVDVKVCGCIDYDKAPKNKIGTGTGNNKAAGTGNGSGGECGGDGGGGDGGGDGGTSGITGSGPSGNREDIENDGKTKEDVEQPYPTEGSKRKDVSSPDSIGEVKEPSSQNTDYDKDNPSKKYGSFTDARTPPKNPVPLKDKPPLRTQIEIPPGSSCLCGDVCCVDERPILFNAQFPKYYKTLNGIPNRIERLALTPPGKALTWILTCSKLPQNAPFGIGFKQKEPAIEWKKEIVNVPKQIESIFKEDTSQVQACTLIDFGVIGQKPQGGDAGEGCPTTGQEITPITSQRFILALWRGSHSVSLYEFDEKEGVYVLHQTQQLPKQKPRGTDDEFSDIVIYPMGNMIIVSDGMIKDTIDAAPDTVARFTFSYPVLVGSACIGIGTWKGAAEYYFINVVHENRGKMSIRRELGFKPERSNLNVNFETKVGANIKKAVPPGSQVCLEGSDYLRGTKVCVKYDFEDDYKYVKYDIELTR